MATGESDNGNGRVTMADRLARIETKLDALLEQGKRCREDHDDLLELRSKVDTLQNRDIQGTVAGIVTGIVAAVIAIFKP